MLSTIYSMTEGRFQQFWLAKTYQFDVSSPPKEVGQNHILEALLKNTIGGITVLHSNEILNGSKALRINGLSAEQKGYPYCISDVNNETKILTTSIIAAAAVVVFTHPFDLFVFSVCE